MKVLLINGSPHEKGCTYTALSLIAGELKAQGIETEILPMFQSFTEIRNSGHILKKRLYRSLLRITDMASEYGVRHVQQGMNLIPLLCF